MKKSVGLAILGLVVSIGLLFAVSASIRNDAMENAPQMPTQPLVPTQNSAPTVSSPKVEPVAPTPVEDPCDPSYPDVCIPRYPPDLDCGEISHRNFKVIPPDRHGFDRDNDGIGCET